MKTLRRHSRAYGVAVCSIVALAAGACSDVTYGDGAPVSIRLTAQTSSVQAGTPLAFDYQAAGTLLQGIVLDYGDGLADSVFTYGAQSSSGRALHAFESAGEYTVVGKAIDASRGTATSSPLTIQVTPPPEGSP